MSVVFQGTIEWKSAAEEIYRQVQQGTRIKVKVPQLPMSHDVVPTSTNKAKNY